MFELNPNIVIVFLGDLIDRGPFSVEIFYIAMQLYLTNPNSVVVCRGNHENESTLSLYGFSHDMIHSRYGENNSEEEAFLGKATSLIKNVHLLQQKKADLMRNADSLLETVTHLRKESDTTKKHIYKKKHA